MCIKQTNLIRWIIHEINIKFWAQFKQVKAEAANFAKKKRQKRKNSSISLLYDWTNGLSFVYDDDDDDGTDVMADTHLPTKSPWVSSIPFFRRTQKLYSQTGKKIGLSWEIFHKMLYDIQVDQTFGRTFINLLSFFTLGGLRWGKRRRWQQNLPQGQEKFNFPSSKTTAKVYKCRLFCVIGTSYNLQFNFELN